MVGKICTLVVLLSFIISIPAFAELKVEWDTITGWGNASSDLLWDTGFITRGDWSLGPNFAFFLKDEISSNQTDQQWQGSLDRCYLQYEQGPTRFNLGRQGVSWGIGWFFRPTDLITPLTPLAEEDTRPGKDLAMLRWSTSALTADDLIAGNDLFAVRKEWRIGATNLRVLGVYQPEYIDTIGYDFQGGLAGFYGEGTYRWAATDTLAQGRFAGLIGWQKVVWSGDQLFTEYFRNDLRTDDTPELANLLALNENSEIIYTNQNYLAVGLKIPWDQLTTVALSVISNLDDSGTMLEGNADVQITDNLEVLGTLIAVLGPDSTEFMTETQKSRIGITLEIQYYF